MSVIEVYGPITKIDPKKNDFKIIHIRVNRELKEQLKLDSRTKNISVIGDIKNVCVGEVFSGLVEESHHKIYGRQFKIRGGYTVKPPEKIEDKKALMGYMSDKFADGIGEELAEDLLESFGQNIIKELEIISQNAIGIVKESALVYGIEDLSLLTKKHNKKINIFDGCDPEKTETENIQQIIKFMALDLKKNSDFCKIVERLLLIPNIGLTRIINIIIGWELDRNKRESFIYFSSLGFTNYQVEEILSCCEKNGINNPISFVQDNTIYAIYDIGAEVPFRVVDEAAVKMSIWKDDPKRIEYVLQYAVKEKTNEGHVCYPAEEIKLEASKYCSSSAINSWLEKHAVKSLNDVFEDGAVLPAVIYDCTETSNPDPREKMMYTNFMFSCECYSAKAINMLLSRPVNYLKDVVQEEIVQPYESDTHIKLDESQIDALMLSANSRISVLTGGPGTGKTTIMKALASWLKNVQKRPVVLCAPTGKAARRLQSATGIQSYTIHRAIGLKIPVLSTKVLKRINKGDFFIVGDEETCWDDSTIIIDESSMMDIHLATLLLCKASVSSNAQILFVGDVDQLPSVGPGVVLHSLITCGKIPVSRLQVVHRQKDGGIVETAKIIRELPSDVIVDDIPGVPFMDRLEIANDPSGEMFFLNHETICSSYMNKDPGSMLFEDSVRYVLGQFYTNNYFETYFNTKTEDVQLLVPMRNKSCGIISLNFYLQKLCNKHAATYLNTKIPKTEKELNSVSLLDMGAFGKMKKEVDFFIDRDYGSEKEKEEHPWRWFIGDKAMCIKNDYKNEVYNGELGIVIDVNAKSKLLTVEYPDISVVCNYGYKENKDEGIMPLGHLQPAYVSTIHKSQGSEYPVVVLVIAKENTIMLKRRLIYTAITRAKNTCIIIFENEALERSLQNYMDQPRMTNLVDKICLFPKHIYEEDLKCVNDLPLF